MKRRSTYQALSEPICEIQNRTVRATQDYRQKGVISMLLRCLVVDGLLWDFYEAGCWLLVMYNNWTNKIIDKSTDSEMMQGSLKLIKTWCFPGIIYLKEGSIQDRYLLTVTLDRSVHFHLISQIEQNQVLAPLKLRKWAEESLKYVTNIWNYRKCTATIPIVSL